MWANGNPPQCGQAFVSGQTINILLSCVGASGTLPMATPWHIDLWVGLLPPGIYNVVSSYLPGGGYNPASPLPLNETRLIVQEANPEFQLSPNAAHASVARHCGDQRTSDRVP